MAAADRGPVTWDKLLTVLDEMVSQSANFTRREIARKVEPWADRIHDLEVRSLRDAGVWRQGKTYRIGDCVTDKGGWWICLEPTSSRPGSDKCWRLTAKTNGHGA